MYNKFFVAKLLSLQILCDNNEKYMQNEPNFTNYTIGYQLYSLTYEFQNGNYSTVKLFQLNIYF